MVLFFAHIPFVVDRAFQRNASGEVATMRYSTLSIAVGWKQSENCLAPAE